MSEWFEVKDPQKVDLSDDGKFVHILFQTNRNGNRYVEVPVELLVKLLAAEHRVHADAVDSAVSTSSLQASADTTSQTVTKRTQRG